MIHCNTVSIKKLHILNYDFNGSLYILIITTAAPFKLANNCFN